MTSAKDKYAAIVENLYDRTANDKLKWETTSQPDIYSVQVGSHVLRINEIPRRNSTSDIMITIYNESGSLSDSFTDLELGERTPQSPGFDGYYKMMKEIHRLAARVATGADKSLDAILHELGIEPIKE